MFRQIEDNKTHWTTIAGVLIALAVVGGALLLYPL
jgi:hypothetical protein